MSPTYQEMVQYGPSKQDIIFSLASRMLEAHAHGGLYATNMEGALTLSEAAYTIAADLYRHAYGEGEE